MLLIGDVHGLFFNYKEILKTSKANRSLQLGDFGVGFPSTPDAPDVEDGHLFIRGNHDNPIVCRNSSTYAGDYGILEGSYIDKRFNKLFFLSGAWSIDQEYRTKNVDWWEDEQLSYEELCDAINLYEKEKPEIICSHDCPTLILQYIHPSRVIPTRTSQALDTMLQIHKPSYWIFGHHHMSWKRLIDKTYFICLNELETLDISKTINYSYC